MDFSEKAPFPKDPLFRTRHTRVALWLLGKVSRLVQEQGKKRVASLEAQQRYFSYRATLAAIVSQNSFVLVFVGGVSHNYRAICCKMGCRTDVPV